MEFGFKKLYFEWLDVCTENLHTFEEFFLICQVFFVNIF